MEIPISFRRMAIVKANLFEKISQRFVKFVKKLLKCFNLQQTRPIFPLAFYCNSDYIKITLSNLNLPENSMKIDYIDGLLWESTAGQGLQELHF